MPDLTELTIHDLGARFRSGEATPTRAVSAYLSAARWRGSMPMRPAARAR